jgi:hypothetical protein
MKKQIALFFSFTVIISLLGFIQTTGFSDKDNIAWQKTTKLAWTDFKGKVDTKKTIPGYAYLLINYNSALKPDSMYITVTDVFYRGYSWINEKSKTKEQLNHQQGCFNLVEVACRNFRKSIATNTFYKSSANNTLRAMYSAAIKEKNNLLVSYYNETKNGTDKVKQAEWDKKIAADLKKTDAYNKQIVPIKMY